MASCEERRALRKLEGQVEGARRLLSAEYHALVLADPVGARMARALTPSQLQVLGCLADAMTNQTIATQLGISIETVKRHLSSIYDKLGVSSRLEAVVTVHQHPALRDASQIPSQT